MPDTVVGLLSGAEDRFAESFFAAVERLGGGRGVRAEMAVLGGTAEIQRQRYAVIVDRISHRVPYYRAHLKSAALQGTIVVNDPFWSSADEPFFQFTLARRLGIAVPRTIALPNREYAPGIDPETSLHNLEYPLDWDAIVRYTGLPAVLRANTGGGFLAAQVVDSLEALLDAYDRSGTAAMLLQEHIAADDHLRCLCIGRDQVLSLRSGPDPGPTAPFARGGGERASGPTRLLCEALGYDVNAVTFAVRDGDLVALDLFDPVPDLDGLAGDEEAFQWVLERMSELAVGYAAGEAEPPWRGEHRFWRHLPGALPAR